jgi:cytochrome c oxidase subunit 2
MSLFVVVEEPTAFADWLVAQRASAAAAAGPLAERGRDLFFASGCGACHAVRGTPADGVLGPDLTHVGSRLSLGAGALTNDTQAFRRFVARTGEVKPSVHMPAFGMLPDADLDALAAYLEGLK